MSTIKLLWNTTWRGGAWGLLGGTMLGTAYGAIFANALFLFGLAQAPFDLRGDDIPRAFAAILVLALIGAVMGALFGVPTGFVVGALNGLLIGIITRAFFFPLRDARTYRRVIAVVSALFTVIASWLGFLVIMLFYANREKANVEVLAVGVLIPALIAGIVAALISRVIAWWYEKESAK
ncbi:MAG: hypothetical protein L0Y55_04920 [Anaerolineales bacterium]|nr:hypothetical protein [Anaerolineales bacterium]